MAAMLDFLSERFLLLFLSTSHPMLPTLFQVNWPIISEERAKNRFSRWQPWWPFWISNQKDFSHFLIYKLPRLAKNAKNTHVSQDGGNSREIHHNLFNTIVGVHSINRVS